MDTGADRLLRRQEVEEMFSISSASLYRAMAKGRFPRPIKLAAGHTGAVRWRKSDLDRFIAECPLGGNQPVAS